jgi:hypothetical protein
MGVDVQEMIRRIKLRPGNVLIKYIDLPERYKGLVYFSPRHIDKKIFD